MGQLLRDLVTCTNQLCRHPAAIFIDLCNMCDKSLNFQTSCCDGNIKSLPVDSTEITPYCSLQSSIVTSRLCLICNNDNTFLLASLKQNPFVINIQHDGNNELTIIVHDSTTSTIDLINNIHQLGFNACAAPSTQQCYVRPADKVINIDGGCGGAAAADSCCSSQQKQTGTSSCCEINSNPSTKCDSGKQTVQSAYWLRIAVLLSCFSICWEIIEGSTSAYFGSTDGSVSLWEFGADSLIEMISASLIVYRFYGQLISQHSSFENNNRKERAVTFMVGLLLSLLALATMAVSIHGLVTKATPSSTIPGIIISAISFCIMFGLYFSKTFTGVKLSSSAVSSDAICTYCCMQLSTCVFISSMSFYFDQSLWWFDSAFALGISILIIRESYGILKGVYTGRDSCCAPPTSDSWLIKQIKQRYPTNVSCASDEISCTNTVNVTHQCSSS